MCPGAKHALGAASITSALCGDALLQGTFMSHGRGIALPATLTGKPFHSRTPTVTNAVSSLPPGLNLQSQQPERSSVLKQLKKCNMTNTIGKAETSGHCSQLCLTGASCIMQQRRSSCSKNPFPFGRAGGASIYVYIFQSHAALGIVEEKQQSRRTLGLSLGRSTAVLATP